MNKANVKYWTEDGTMHGEWADRSLDDEDRDLPDTIKITASRAVGRDFETTRLMVEKDLLQKYDQWLEDTR